MRAHHLLTTLPIASALIAPAPLRPRAPEPFSLTAIDAKPHARLLSAHQQPSDLREPTAPTSDAFTQSTRLHRAVEPTPHECSLESALTLTPTTSNQQASATDKKRPAAKTVLDETMARVNAALSEFPIHIQGRVKSKESQTAKAIKLKMQTILGPEQWQAMTDPKLDTAGLTQAIKTHWPALHEATLHTDTLDDVIGLRVIATDNCDETCYQALKTLVDTPTLDCFFKFEPKAFDDYIKHRKANGYQSLHGLFVSKINPSLKVEVQVRTEQMDKEATQGDANHGGYKQLAETLFQLFEQESARRFGG